MMRSHLWSYDSTKLAWLQAGLAPSGGNAGCSVAELLPGGFDAYVRIFHQFEAPDGSGLTQSWWSRAADSGESFHAELTHYSLLDAPKPVWLARTGEPDDRTRRALVRVLTATTGDEPVFFAYDLEALLNGEEQPLIRTAPLPELETLRKMVEEEHTAMDGPEFWWPHDRSWVVTSDHDLTSTYVGCSQETAERILSDDEIEALSVTPHTRVV
ncbi:hypothetical protein GCM10009544_01790 [Streptomyces stramineus]|uniref:Uncharacterized protein n=2 Tax=Streptomyces TaxID=1883 RepID=A0ABN0ZC97_9ACTN